MRQIIFAGIVVTCCGLGAVVGARAECPVTNDAAPFLVRTVAAGTNDSSVITFDSCPTHLYVVEAMVELPTTAPVPLATLIGSDGTTSCADTNPVAGTPRYYRVKRFTFDDDQDGDSLTNLAEYTLGTNLQQADTDGDGLPDGWEVRYALNPLATAGNDGASGDPDGDGISNRLECLRGSDPTKGIIPDGAATVALEVFTPLE